jgi:hypothetical protein
LQQLMFSLYIYLFFKGDEAIINIYSLLFRL